MLAQLIFVVFALCGSVRDTSHAWDFSEAGLDANVTIWRFTIWRNKAYLAVPRWNHESVPMYTLLEAPWPEDGNLLPIGSTLPTVIPFPNRNSQRHGECQNLQSVTGLDSDVRGRLWVLDAPTRDTCPAKIVLFDLRRHEEVTRVKLIGVSSRDLRCLVVDPIVGQWGNQAYVSTSEDESIIVYSPGQKRWWTLKLSTGSHHAGKIFSSDLAISRRSSLLYLTGYESDDLFSVDLEILRGSGEQSVESNSTAVVVVSWVGSKIGASSGLICDSRGGVHYFVLSEVASVRWDSREKLKAESHSISLQSEKVRCVTDYAMDAQKNVWALVNDAHPFARTRIIESGKENGSERRAIRVYKYTAFAQYRSP